MAETAEEVKTENTTSEKQEVKIPTIDETIALARGEKQATPVVEEKKEEPKISVTGTTEEKPSIPQGELSDDEFNIDDIIRSLDNEHEKPTDQPKGEVKDSYTLKDIASLLGVEADSPEAIKKAYEAKVQLQAQSVTDETRPLRDLDTIISLDDKALLTQVKKWDGYTDEEVTQYLDSLEESKGKAGIRNEALDIRVNLRNGRAELEKQIAEKQVQKQQIQKNYETDIRSRINKMDNVFGVPVSKEDNEAFATEVLSRSYDEQMQDPDKYLSAMRLVRDFAKVKETIFKNGAKAGAKQMKNIYEQKLHNKDLNTGQRGGKAPQEEKEKTVNSQVDEAQRAIREKAGIVRPA
jgi:hypothetical protein